MTYAILSDVHGNLEALRAVLDDCVCQGAERIMFLGDAVGYGADPGPCIELLRSRAHVMIMGNHDGACAAGSDIEGLNPHAAEALLWTRHILPPHEISFLTELPMELREDGMLFVHGSPYEPNRWHYILSEHDAERGFSSCRDQLVFVGHTHKPLTCIETGRKRVFGGEVRRVELDYSTTMSLSVNRRYILNAGSVGQPRDHDPRAAYGLYDSSSSTFLVRRVPYDWDEASRKILRNGLPGFLADRIKEGI